MNYYCCQLMKWYFILYLHFSLFVLIDESIYHPVFLVASIIFGCYIISYAEFQSCLLTPFKCIVLVLKPYIILYVFSFDRSYWSRTLSSMICTLAVSNIIIIWPYMYICYVMLCYVAIYMLVIIWPYLYIANYYKMLALS